MFYCFHYVTQLFTSSQTSLRDFLIHALYKILEHIHNFCVEVLLLLHFSGLPGIGLLASGGSILAWSFMFVFLHWDLGTWNYDDFLGVNIWSHLSWLDVPFFGFCCPLWILDKCGGFGVGVHSRECFYGQWVVKLDGDMLNGGLKMDTGKNAEASRSKQKAEYHRKQIG